MIPQLEQPFDGRGTSVRHVSILGSTGSIGTQTLDVIRLFPDRFVVDALAAHSNWEMIARQAQEFEPQAVVIQDREKAADLEKELAFVDTEVLVGESGLKSIAQLDTVDVVVAAIVGFAGLPPVVSALQADKTVALANKETLVVAGAFIEQLLREGSGTVIPVDSEHSAIFQCLVGEARESVERLTLTASGGPFWDRPADTFGDVSPGEAIDHPNWSMGPKISVDSATMMNKGLEVIEACWLFDVSPDRVDVLVHPESVVHSIITFTDGSSKAQLGVPDMKVPIQYALTFPERWPAGHERIDWAEVNTLRFAEPQHQKFPCLRLAYAAIDSGGLAPAVLNAANEEAVELFLNSHIGFDEIPRVIEHVLDRTDVGVADDLEAIQAADDQARIRVRELVRGAAD